jgi:hypothetical protein
MFTLILLILSVSLNIYAGWLLDVRTKQQKDLVDALFAVSALAEARKGELDAIDKLK